MQANLRLSRKHRLNTGSCVVFVVSAVILSFSATPAQAQLSQAELERACKEGNLAIRNPAHLIRRCFSEQELSQLMRAVTQQRDQLGTEERRTADDLARIFRVERGVIDYWFGMIGDENLTLEEMSGKLWEYLKRHKELAKEIEGLQSTGEAGQAWSDILSKVQNGEYDAASDLALSMRDRVIANSAGGPDGQQAKRRRLSASEAAIAQIALVRTKYTEAVDHFLTASDLAIGDEKMRQTYREAAANALYLQAGTEWNQQALEKAIAIYKELLGGWPVEQVPGPWAETQVKLGNTLIRLGTGQGSTLALRDAVSAFRAALQVRSKDRDPVLWTEAQARLASGLFHLGLRQNGTADLLESIDAYRLALSEVKLEGAPEEWVSLHNGLGAALWSLGTREDGTRHLAQSVTAFSEALKGLDTERSPRDWGATQNNLGAAFFALAERETGYASLNRAIDAFKKSLLAYQEASALYFVVGVKKNLARAEALLRERRSKSGRR